MGILLVALPFSEVSSEENWKTKKNSKKVAAKNSIGFFAATFLLFFKCFF